METLPAASPLTGPERDRLAGLLAALPPSSRWWVSHMHAPLLCAVGVLGAPDVAYEHAAHRRFADVEESRRRALALLAELDRAAPIQPPEPAGSDGRRFLRFLSGARRV
jgi:hypothetical protein